MMRFDNNALICDMAETYGIYDYRSLPLLTVATLAAGLRDNSRIKMKMTGTKVSDELLLLAHAVDRLGILVWQRTKDGTHGRNKPPQIVDSILNENKNRSRKAVQSFGSPEEFWAARQKIIEGGGRK